MYYMRSVYDFAKLHGSLTLRAKNGTEIFNQAGTSTRRLPVDPSRASAACCRRARLGAPVKY